MDIGKCVAGDLNNAVIAGSSVVLNCNRIVTGVRKAAARHRDIFDMPCVNALAAIGERAVYDLQVADLAVVVLVVVAKGLTLVAFRSVGSERAIIKGDTINQSVCQGRGDIHIAREIQAFKLDVIHMMDEPE